MAEDKKYDHSKYRVDAKPNGVTYIAGEKLNTRDRVWFEPTADFKFFKKGKTYGVHRWILEGVAGDSAENKETQKKSLKGRGLKYKVVDAPVKRTIEEINTEDVAKSVK